MCFLLFSRVFWYSLADAGEKLSVVLVSVSKARCAFHLKNEVHV